MKKTLLSLLTLCLLGVGNAFAQDDIVVGDMDNSGDLTISDVTALADAVVHPDKVRTISTKCDPNASAPAAIAGSWRAVSGTALTLTAEGDATYSLDASVKGFEYYPFSRDVVLLTAEGYAVKCLHVARLTADYLVFSASDGTCSAFYPSDHFASGFVLSATNLSLKTGETQRLTVLATPDGAIAPAFKWTSSDSAVATVTADGLVTAVKGGTCTITATAQDGSTVSVSCTVSVVQLVESITLSTTKLSLDLGDTKKVIATVLPADANDLSCVWSSSNEDVAEVSRYGNVTANGYGTCTITATANDGSGVMAECVIVVEKPHEYVDLGLPSGTLWATCNVGAENPEDYGYYFAWGEVEDKSYYNWGTYFDSDLQKYNNNGGKTELDLEDDAAYINWGEGWRLPSSDQIMELCNSNYTTTEWTTRNGKSGRLITSKSNGASLFLPAAGSRYKGSLDSAGSYGNYWSRSLRTDYKDCAYHLGFNSSYVNWYYGVICYGFSVRPVRVSGSE